MEEGVRLPSPGDGRERVLSLHGDHRRPASGAKVGGADGRGATCLQRLEQDVRAGPADFGGDCSLISFGMGELPAPFDSRTNAARRHSRDRLRPADLPRAAGGAGSASACAPLDLPRRARAGVGLAGLDRACGCARQGERRRRPTPCIGARTHALGGPDAAGVRARRAALRALRRASEADRTDPGPLRRAAHPRTPRAPERAAAGGAGAGASAARARLLNCGGKAGPRATSRSAWSGGPGEVCPEEPHSGV